MNESKGREAPASYWNCGSYFSLPSEPTLVEIREWSKTDRSSSAPSAIPTLCSWSAILLVAAVLRTATQLHGPEHAWITSLAILMDGGVNQACFLQKKKKHPPKRVGSFRNTLSAVCRDQDGHLASGLQLPLDHGKCHIWSQPLCIIASTRLTP